FKEMDINNIKNKVQDLLKLEINNIKPYIKILNNIFSLIHEKNGIKNIYVVFENKVLFYIPNIEIISPSDLTISRKEFNMLKNGHKVNDEFMIYVKDNNWPNKINLCYIIENIYINKNYDM